MLTSLCAVVIFAATIGFVKSSEDEKAVDTMTLRKLPAAHRHESSILHPVAEKTDVELFHELARSLPSPLTDKCGEHQYAEMYGSYFVPYLRRQRHLLKKGIKFLEIGLGCNMGYREGAIASVQLWQSILNDQDEYWEAEYKEECVKELQEKGKLTGVNIVTGDQGNVTVLQRWIQETGGHFDVIIDDGGHHNNHIYESFMNLWPIVKPGGLYFIEDMQVGRHPDFSDLSGRGIIMIDYIKAWIEQIVISSWGDHPDWGVSPEILKTKKIPPGIRFITCIRDACVIGKCDGKPGTWCSS